MPHPTPPLRTNQQTKTTRTHTRTHAHTSTYRFSPKPWTALSMGELGRGRRLAPGPGKEIIFCDRSRSNSTKSAILLLQNFETVGEKTKNKHGLHGNFSEAASTHRPNKGKAGLRRSCTSKTGEKLSFLSFDRLIHFLCFALNQRDLGNSNTDSKNIRGIYHPLRL